MYVYILRTIEDNVTHIYMSLPNCQSQYIGLVSDHNNNPDRNAQSIQVRRAW